MCITLVVVAGMAPAAAQQEGVVFADDFESGDLGLWDQVDTRRYSVTDDPAHVASGEFALEGAISDDPDWGEINKWFLPGLDAAYLKFDVMFEDGFANLRGDGNGMHFASVAGNRVDDRWSSHGQAGIVPDGTDFFVTTVDPNHRYGDPSLEPFTFYTYYPDMTCCYGNVFPQGDPVDLVGGRWYEVIVFVDAGSPGRADGRQTLWIDGVERIDVAGIRWRDTDDLRINEIAFVHYMPDPPQTQRIWVDDVSVTTGFPGSSPVVPGPFDDVSAGHPFADEIGWLAGRGITRGCNPPDNTRYCPEDVVSRQQMASFLVRALNTPPATGDRFGDDDGVHEGDIDALAAAGVARGCNPPDNDRFCPLSSITRAEMAAFLVRGLGLGDSGGGNTFVDDDASEFSVDIARLAAAGITRGCNPPDNDRFCPNEPITRGQMAAFLRRAQPWLP
jgi:hypothetical protein